MALTTHTELRRCAQWAFPGTLAIANAAWDGVEDMQTYITREWTAQPSQTLPTAVQIAAQETAWRVVMLTIPKKARNTEVNALRATKLATGITFNAKSFDASAMSVGAIAAKYEQLKRENAATARTITGVSLANPAVISSTAHGFSNSDRIDHQGVGGTVELSGVYTIGNVTANTYELTGTDSTAWTAFTTGGTAALVCEWTSADNVINELTVADFLTLTNALNNYSDLCFRTARQHKNAIAALTSMANVSAYDITVNWPSTTY